MRNQNGKRPSHLDYKSAEDNTAEDGVVEDAFEDVALAVDLAGVDLVEQLHQHKRVKDDGVVFGGRRVEGGVPAAVDVEQFLPCRGEETGGRPDDEDQSVPVVYSLIDRFCLICE